MSEELDKLVPLAELARELPGKPHPGSVARWCQNGIKGVKLWSQRVGGRRCSTRSALQQFFALTGGASNSILENGEAASAPVPSACDAHPPARKVHWSIDPDLRRRGEEARRLLYLEGPAERDCGVASNLEHAAGAA